MCRLFWFKDGTDVSLRLGEKTSNSERALQASDACRTQTSSVGSQGSRDTIREDIVESRVCPWLCKRSSVCLSRTCFSCAFNSPQALKENWICLTHLPNCYKCQNRKHRAGILPGGEIILGTLRHISPAVFCSAPCSVFDTRLIHVSRMWRVVSRGQCA